jgi:hypothetical protein
MDVNDLYEHVWNVGTLLMSEDSLDILQDGFRPWPRVQEGSEASWDFYDIHDRNKAMDLMLLRKYQDREDIVTYTVILQEVLHLFGQGIHESLTRTMANYLEATGGRLSNNNKTPWEQEIAAKMICTNNPAEGPFATVKAFLNMYPSLKLRTVASLSAAICNGTHRPSHGTGHNAKEAGLALNSPARVKEAVTKLCCVRTKSPGALTVMMLSISTGALTYIGSLMRFFVIVLLHFKLCITMGLYWKDTCSGGLMTLRENLGS